jgi:hypothetical protein
MLPSPLSLKLLLAIFKKLELERWMPYSPLLLQVLLARVVVWDDSRAIPDLLLVLHVLLVRTENPELNKLRP